MEEVSEGGKATKRAASATPTRAFKRTKQPSQVTPSPTPKRGGQKRKLLNSNSNSNSITTTTVASAAGTRRTRRWYGIDGDDEYDEDYGNSKPATANQSRQQSEDEQEPIENEEIEQQQQQQKPQQAEEEDVEDEEEIQEENEEEEMEAEEIEEDESDVEKRRKKEDDLVNDEAEGLMKAAAKAAGVKEEDVESVEKIASSVAQQVAAEQSAEDAMKKKERQTNIERLEREFAEIKEKLFAERIAVAEKEIDSARQGNHPLLIAQIAEADEWRVMREWAAEKQKIHQEEEANLLYEHEKEVAETECVSEKQATRDKLLATLQEKRRKILDDKQQLTIYSDAGPGARGLRSRKTNTTNPIGSSMPSQRRKVATTHLVFALKEQEIQDDFIAIGLQVSNSTM